MTRDERPEDYAAVYALVAAAFERAVEADLVDALRAACPQSLSLVAEDDGAITGHVLFTPCWVEAGESRLEGMGLAPLAVTPGLQRTGIGSELSFAGLDRLRREGCPFAVVLGHADYYPRFGFVPAGRYGLSCKWPVPEGVFMALELQPGTLAPYQGQMVHYDAVFDQFA